MIWVLRIFGHPVITFGPEHALDELDEQRRIDNTGGYFEIAEEAYSPEDEYEESEFGFGVPR